MPGQQHGSGALSSDDKIIQKGKEIARKEGLKKGARHIEKEMAKEAAKGASKGRLAQLRAAAKLLKQAAARGIKIGGLVIGIILELADPAEAEAPAPPENQPEEPPGCE